MPRLLLRVAAAFMLLLGAACLARAEPTAAGPTYPEFSGLVVDAAHILGDGDRAALTRKLTELERKTGVQFAVATVPSLEGLEIEPYANGLFRKWGIGQKGSNNGLLLVLAPNERKLRFEIGYGLEGTLTDAQSKLILHNDMVPKLKEGNAAGALRAGVDDAIAVLTKDASALPPDLRAKEGQGLGTFGVVFFIVFGLVFVTIFVLAFRFRGRGWSRSWSWGTGSAIGSSMGSDWSSGNTWSSGDNSSSGDSGFSGGGGGDSGGGGSSDSY